MSQNKKKKNWLLISLGIILVALLALAIVKGNNKPKGKIVTIEKSELRTIKETVSASGRIFPEKEVKISSDVSGQIVELYVQEGDSVVAGQLLAKIDPDTYVSAVERGEAALNSTKSQLSISKAQVENSKAQKEQIVAQLENQRNIHSRNEKLRKDGVISQAELEQSLSALRSLEANLRAAEASIRSAQQNAEASEFQIKGSQASLKELKTSLSRTTIVSPVNGIVSSLSVEKGERVVGTIQMTGTEMMRIANLNAMEVQVNVSENDILKVTLGDTADIEVDSYLGTRFKGVVSQIANSAANVSAATALNTDQVTNFVVKIRVLEDSYQSIKTASLKYPLRPGMSASVDIYTDDVKGIVSVPIQCVTIRTKEKDDTAIKTSKEEEYDEVVFLMEADTAKMVVVKTGIQDNEYIAILEGLIEGLEVISGPYTELSKNLKAGEKVRLKKETKEKDKK
ncbi:MAG: efflux RND transporter periplasmic adaptor subunit [Saprospiraceae bacterium]|nr:efflux RND transporter periplasmic adaptor subunit [Saprospiraceae bacterium]